ncbi:hypothetical protein Acid7E03_10900 [Acidisoma sp. 7E03]
MTKSGAKGAIMAETTVRRVDAVHPHWSGVLLLSMTDDTVAHEGHDSRGTYTLAGEVLTVFWDRHAPDVFHARAGLFLHRSLLNTAPAPDHLSVVAIGGASVQVNALTATVPGEAYAVQIRLRTSDVPVFAQVFIEGQYHSPHLPTDAATILDLGSNVGYAAVSFALRYPGARLLAVEPESGNFAALQQNTAALGARVQALRAAVWTRDGSINLHTQDAGGAPLDAWGFQVSDRPAAMQTPCFSLQSLCDRLDAETIDILKVDIEGAELEVFAETPAAVLRRARLIIIETHDRFRPGSEAAVRRALAADFTELPGKSENLFFRRRF